MTRHAIRPPDGPATEMADLMASWQAMGLGAMNLMGSGWAEAMSDMGSEWLQFVTRRVKADVKFQHALLHARNPQEVHSLQSDFFQKAVDDYTAETGKMVSMSSKLFTPDG